MDSSSKDNHYKLSMPSKQTNLYEYSDFSTRFIGLF